MTTLNLQVGASADDAWERGDSLLFSATENQVRVAANASASSRFNGGFRFTGAGAINPGDTIDAATMQVKPISTSVDDASLDIYFEDADSPVDFTATASVNSRTQTSASVSWSATSLGTSFVTTPDIKSVVQEVADRAGFGGVFMSLFYGKTAGTGHLYPKSYDSGSTEAAKLDIDFTAGGGISKQLLLLGVGT